MNVTNSQQIRSESFPGIADPCKGRSFPAVVNHCFNFLWKTSIGKLMVDYSPSTRATGVRFPAIAASLFSFFPNHRHVPNTKVIGQKPEDKKDGVHNLLLRNSSY